jgi:hypothetical protein
MVIFSSYLERPVLVWDWKNIGMEVRISYCIWGEAQGRHFDGIKLHTIDLSSSDRV